MIVVKELSRKVKAGGPGSVDFIGHALELLVSICTHPIVQMFSGVRKCNASVFPQIVPKYSYLNTFSLKFRFK